ncbi:hypothetical protein RJT34_11021 [Clitoria ternatea]|uniref:TF-B3 domain-containing protein n=1 Tax=Clitoria ternatea TaxID=43366 RepID=A0AAN9PJN2_CLITE
MDLFDLNPGEDVGTPSPSASPSSTHSCISTSASALVPSLPPSAPTSSSVCLELWHACAGPLISLPKKGSVVVYLPRRHFEQSQDFPLTSCNNIPPHVFCRVLDVKLHAEEESDEVFCQVLLVPESEQVEQSLREGEVDADGEEEDTEAMVKSTTPHMFCKTLTASDTSHGGFSVPRRAAEDCFPPLDYHLRPSQELVAKDLHGLKWKFRHIYRGQPRRHLLTTGWSTFVNKKKLVSGDTVLFLRAEDGELRLGIRRENQLKSAGSFAGPSGQKLNPATVMDVVNALSTRCAFSVCYNPRASSSEFIIPVHRFLKSLDCPYSVEKRFMMHFGTEDAAERRYPHLGTTLHHVYRPQRWFSPSENLSNTKPLTPSENLSNTKPLTAWTNVENKIIKKVKYVAPKPLHIEEVKSLLDMESDDKAVRMLSIYGSDKIKGTMLGSTKHEVVDWSGSAVQDMKRLDSIKHDWSGSAFEDKKRLDSIKHDWNGGAFEDMKQLDSIKHDWSGGALVDIKRLEITSLTVRDTSLSSELQHLLDNLKYLHWEVSPLNSLPQKFPPKKASKNP